MPTGGAGQGSWTPWAAVAETTTAAVLFAGDHALKLKKPLDFGYVDFRSLESRRLACHEEVRLNRRLAPDVYLGVADLRDSDDAVVDHAVLMRRMPAYRRLTALLAETEAVQSGLRDVARLLADFHSAAEVVDGPDSPGTAQGVCALWREGVEGLDAVGADVVPERTRLSIARLGEAFLAGRGRLLDHRVRSGLVRDGHGDLLADDIFLLSDGPRVLDCLEFDRRLRVGDVWLDVAFLAMDLERLGHPEHAAWFLQAYREHSGPSAPSSLLHFFIAYRAHIRAKVAAIRRAQGAAGSAREARSLAALALRHLEDGAVTLTVIGGLPGSGKTTVAAGLAERTGAVHLSSDAVRIELQGDRAANASGFESGRYAPERTGAVYDEMLRRAELALAMGESVVLDATWRDAGRREGARAVARRSHAVLSELQCRVDEDTARGWLAARTDGPSEATPETRRRMVGSLERWPESRRLDTARSDVVERAVAVVRRTVVQSGT
jgi:aminoglycoside phosphotransferase family enzyme/predicted kinase